MAGMQIYVSYHNTQLQLQVESSDSVENVKQKIQDQTQIEPARMILTYQGTTLLDGLTLADYNIQPESTIRMTLPEHSSFNIFVVIFILILFLVVMYMWVTKYNVGRGALSKAMMALKLSLLSKN